MTQDPPAQPTTNPAMHTAKARLARLCDYLEQDPENRPLLLDAADAAIAAQRTDLAIDLLSRLEKLGDLPPAASNLKAMAALQAQNFAQAETLFAELIAAGHNDPNVRFNLAWTKAVRGDYAGALALLDTDAVAASPRGPALKVQMLHHLARLDQALADGEVLLAAEPGNEELAGALSVAAMDAGDIVRAAGFAAQGGTTSNALTTQGLIALANHERVPALALFERVLDTPGAHPRAWLGRGLALLSDGEADTARVDLEKAATLFRSHIGSWIAAGWAHYAARDLASARRCFSTALTLDDTFAESHGSLAVLDFVEGHIAEARRGAAIALRLNRQCFSGALAKSMLAEHDDNPALAQKIRERAMNVAIGPNGETIARALITMGLNPHKSG